MYAYGLALNAQWSRAQRPRDYPKALASLNDAPPFLPYLCLLCLAWTEDEDEDLADHAFFARLEVLVPDHGLRNRLSHWSALWDALQHWTEKLGGKFGIFVVERLGGMPHVGIAKAQVILTPGRIERLPDFFIDLNLSPTVMIQPVTLRRLIMAGEAISSQYFSRQLLAEISADTDMGKATISLLLEYLEAWDGTPSERRRHAGSGDRAVVRLSPLCIVLESSENNDGWKVRLGVEEDREAESLKFPDYNWGIRSVSPQLALMVTISGSWVDATGILESDESLTLESEWREPSTIPSPCYNYRARKIMVFDNWVGPRLVESQRLANSDGLRLLISSRASAEWDAWRRVHGSELVVTDETQPGLPARFRLLFIKGLDRVDQTALSALLGRSGAIDQRARVTWLSGGTRIRSSASRRVYAEYDPPLLHVQKAPASQLSVSGASAREIGDATGAGGRPGDRVYSYSLEIDAGESVVIATVMNDGKNLGSVSFGIERDSTSPAAMHECWVDQLGEVGASGGLIGSASPATPLPWIFMDRNEEAGAKWQPNDQHRSSFKLLESLHHNGRRISTQEYFRRALEIAGAESWNINQGTRLLAALGHIEIQSDAYGRWSHVHPVPRQLYMLPWKNAGHFQAVACGCGTTKHIEQMVAIAVLLDFEVQVSEVPNSWLPPRLLFLHRDIQAFSYLCEESGTRWISHPAADAIAEWALSLDDWLGSPSIRWHDHEAPFCPAEYIPSRFAIVEGQVHSAPAQLKCMEDPYTHRHYWHVLVRKPKPNAPPHERSRFAFVRDSSWAKWKTHLAIADGEKTLLPYFKHDSRIVVPRELHFPYLLARALCACTGLPPTSVKRSLAYADSIVGVLPEDSPAYERECWSYSGVPLPVAEKVAGRLGAELKDIAT